MSSAQSSSGPQLAKFDALALDAPLLASMYDAIPYPCDAMPQTHPDILAVAAMLQGMTPAATDSCRVLELGCGNGANLLPMAELLPQSRFVGIDLSPRQIADGQAMIAESELGNIELRAADLSTLDDSLGTFDYIICHGIYSWVPKPVQASILALCARHLTAQGVAYISYNTYPGFHKHQAFREMMRYHTASIKDPAEAARQGLELLEFLLHNTADPSGTNAHLLREEVERLRGLPPGYLFHEHLEPDNHPYYFHEFMAAAAAHGLQFLAEADKSGVDLLPAAAQQALAVLRNDVIRGEQYIDFLRNSSLRSTLLCRADITLAREVEPQKLHLLEVRSAAQPKAELKDVHAAGAVAFSTRFGSVTVEHPAVKSLGLVLYRARPGTLSIVELAACISALLGQTMSAAEVCEMVLYSYRIGFVALRPQRRPLAQQVSERPLATPLARLQARRELGVTNLWHEPVAIEPLERRILQKLDGNHDPQALIAELLVALAQGVLPPELSAIPDAGTARNLAPALLSRILDRLQLAALLTS